MYQNEKTIKVGLKTIKQIEEEYNLSITDWTEMRKHFCDIIIDKMYPLFGTRQTLTEHNNNGYIKYGCKGWAIDKNWIDKTLVEENTSEIIDDELEKMFWDIIESL